MAIRSTRDDYQVRGAARYTYGCDGNKKTPHERAPLCSGRIYRCETYVAGVVLAPADRATPRMYVDVSRHCVHCALAFIPQIVVTGGQIEKT